MGEGADVRNEIGGTVGGSVVQAGSIGQVIVHAPGEHHTPVPRQLPPRLRDFIGRHDELVALDALLPTADQPSVSIVLAGAAGIGKTTLALRWAHGVQDRFPDGSLFANLRGFGPSTPLDPGWVLGGFLSALGVPGERVPADLDAQAGLYRSVIAGRRVLVVLDNAATPDQVRALLPGAPGCVAIVTSRTAMTGLVVSDAARPVALDLLTKTEARLLVDTVIGDERVAAEPGAVDVLIELCGRLPLALRIAATRLAVRPHDTVADVVEDITDEQDRVAALSSPGDERGTVRTVFDWSYTHLSAEHAVLFRRLGLHPGAELSEQAAAVLAGLDITEARRQLAVLAEMHLVEPVGRRRYRLHDLLHAYAAQRAENDDPPADRNAALVRIVQWYARAALAADRTAHPGFPALQIELGPGPSVVRLADRTAAMSWLNTELLNLTAALRTATEHGWHAAAIGIAGSMRFLAFRERAAWPMRLDAETLGVAAARASGDRKAETLLLACQGDTFLSLQRWDEAEVAYRREQALGRDLADSGIQCVALIGLAHLRREQGSYAHARALFLEALPLSRQAGGGRSEAVVECNLSIISARTGDYRQALVHAERELALRRQTGDQAGEAFALHNMAIGWQGAGDHRAALDWTQRALALCRSLDTAGRRTAVVLDTAATSFTHTGDRQRAIECLREAVQLLTELDDERLPEVRARLRELETGPGANG